MGREEQVRDAKCTRPSLPVEGLAPRLVSRCAHDGHDTHIMLTDWMCQKYNVKLVDKLVTVFS